jgi:hypothetical protein
LMAISSLVLVLDGQVWREVEKDTRTTICQQLIFTNKYLFCQLFL